MNNFPSNYTTLADALPHEAFNGEYDGQKFLDYKHWRVLFVANFGEIWTGPQRNTNTVWVIGNLSDDATWMVGWNESPSTGWSFNMKKLRNKDGSMTKTGHRVFDILKKMFPTEGEKFSRVYKTDVSVIYVNASHDMTDEEIIQRHGKDYHGNWEVAAEDTYTILPTDQMITRSVRLIAS